MNYISHDKIFYHSKQLNNWEEGEPITPITIEVHPSNQCNNACHYCSMWKVKDAKQMSVDELMYTMHFVKELGAKAIIFSGGGEPLMNPHIKDAFMVCDLDFGVITNGVLLENFTKILSKKATWVRISLDAHNTVIYETIRGTKDFHKVVKNIKQLCAQKYKDKSNLTIGVQMVVDQYNYSFIVDFVQWVFNEFPANLDYVQIRPIEVKLKDEPYDSEQLGIIFKQLEEVKDFSKVIISDKWDLFKGPRNFGFTACHCAPFIGVIDAYLDYYLCCHMVKNPDYKIMNINEGVPKNLGSLYSKFGLTLGFDPKLCPVGCRGASINRALEGLKRGKNHVNFL